MANDSKDTDTTEIAIEDGNYGTTVSRDGRAGVKERSKLSHPSVFMVHLSLAAGYAFFGAGAIVGKFGVHSTSPIMFELFREVISCTLLCIALAVAGKSLIPERVDVVRILMGGVAFFVNQVFWFVGLKLADPVTGSAWQAFLPILTTCVAVLIGQTRMIPLQVVGILIAAGGAVFMVVFDSTKGTSVDIGATPGALVHVMSHLIFFLNILGTSAYFLIHNKLGTKYPAMATVMWSNLVGSVLLFLTACVMNAYKPFLELLCSSSSEEVRQRCIVQGWNVPPSVVAPLVYEIVICTIVAWPLLNWANQHTDPSVVTVYMGMHPVTSTIISIILVYTKGVKWAEHYNLSFPGVQDIGILLIVFGLVVIFYSEQIRLGSPMVKKI